jgi:hypothetical protein
LDIILGTQIVKSYVIVGVEGKFFLEKNNILLAQKEFSQFITTDSHSTPQKISFVNILGRRVRISKIVFMSCATF